MELSVVIPCFNHGKYIQEALDSILAIKGIEYEIIIINDGSTDAYTITKLRELSEQGFLVLSQPNKGLAFSRNRGVEMSKGKYILPVDADNMIKPEYVYKALPLLAAGKADIIYAKPIIFGDSAARRTFLTRPFDVLDLSVENYIDACAIYRKEVWQTTGGYAMDMPFVGQEDWEFWLHAHTRGFKFAFLDEELFYYRVLGNSMIEQTTGADKESLNHQYLLKKHAGLFSENYRLLYHKQVSHQSDVAHPFRSMLKYLYLKHFKAQTPPDKNAGLKK